MVPRAQMAHGVLSPEKLCDFHVLRTMMDPQSAAQRLLDLLVELGIGYEASGQYHLPSLLRESEPSSPHRRCWPTTTAGDVAIGLLLIAEPVFASSPGLFPPGLFHRLQARLCQAVGNLSQIEVWQHGVAITGSALAAIPLQSVQLK
jgi:hypothetical protein